MPNWTDEEGNNWFGKLECKRCLDTFDTDQQGEIPVHKCLDGYCKSFTNLRVSDVYHDVARATEQEIKEFLKKRVR